jgi:hypothetical protein
MPDRIAKGGDCDDQNPQVNPAVVETCNSKDDDCDGVTDNGFTPVLLVTDADGDGFGATTGMSMIGCPPVAGFAPSFDDCNDTDASVHPGAAEIVNGRDDNCNGQRDEAAAGPTAGGPGGITSTPAPVDGGCSAAAPHARRHGLPLLAGALLFGLALARSVSSRRRFKRAR